MAFDANIRASDADRDRVAAALREHLAAGRLTMQEFDDRLDQAFAAITLGDLDRLTADLPGASLDQLPEEGPPGQRLSPGQIAGAPDRHSPAARTFWRPWLTISAIFFLLWLLSGASGGPWFLWIALIAGAVLLLRRSRGGHDGTARKGG